MKKPPNKIALDTDEKVLLITRRHWFTLFVRMLAPVSLFLFSLIALPVFFSFSEVRAVINDAPELIPLAIFFSSLWFLFLWIAIFQIWTDYYLDIWTITSKRIVAIDQRGLFNRHISSFRYERLQDIHVEIAGIIPTFLDFGTLKAETAGDSGEKFIFKGIPRPRSIKAQIIAATDQLAWRRHLSHDADGV